ncbi:hypothetical protein G9A89_010511 [Geosiphon pyriformis]|nr:hypothetical protein G9A89_010511 [Geosiphon pyriformis]
MEREQMFEAEKLVLNKIYSRLIIIKTVILKLCLGPELTKNQWETRNTQLTTLKPAGKKLNSLILVDEYWQNNFLRERESLFKRLSPVLDDNRFSIYKIHFVGHSIGGAYAIIAALSWVFVPYYAIPDYPLAISAITFGAPRVGNRIFARMVNQILNVERITYFNDHVPHFPRRGVGNHLWEHSEIEYWISSCNCSTEENNGEYSLYECIGYRYPNVMHFYRGQLSYEKLFQNTVMSGENENCNAGQSIDNVPGNFIHKGPYFGITMNDCSPNNIQLNLSMYND